MTKLHAVRLRQILPLSWSDDINCEARVSNRAQEHIELEITDKLRAWRHDICRIQIVPNICDSANSDPMITLVCDETLF